MKKKLVHIIAGLALTVLLSTSASAQLLNNGDFESGSLNPGWGIAGTVNVVQSINVNTQQGEQTIPSNGGQYFAMLSNQAAPAVLQSSKFAVTSAPKGIRFQCMYFPSGSDGFFIQVQATKAARMDSMSNSVIDTVLNASARPTGARFPWQTFTLSIPDSLYGGEIPDSMLITFIAGSNQNTGLALDDIYLIDYAASTGTNRVLFGDIELYPNPATSFINLNYVLTMQSDVNVSILDLQGRTVKTVVNENQVNGAYTNKIDLDGLNKGVYFVKVQTDNKVETLRFIVQ
jgi:hypothetical protein